MLITLTKQVSNFRSVLRQIWWPLVLTQLGLIAERVLRSFWPFFTLTITVLALGLLGVQSRLNIGAFWVALAGLGSLIVILFTWGVWKFRLPMLEEALARLDKSMAARPLQGVIDLQALGADDPASKEMWEHHRSWLTSELKKMSAVTPDVTLSAQDPFGLRYFALLIFSLGLIFGSISNLNNLSNQKSTKKDLMVNIPQWEGWIMPPRYSALPTLYLNDILDYPKLAVLKGSTVEVHLYGESGSYTLRETLSDRNSQPALKEKPKQIFQVVQAGRIDIKGPTSAKFDIALSPDDPPLVSWDGKFETDHYGESTFSFKASDDFGVVSGLVQVDLDIANLERKYGLTASPRENSPILSDLPLPFNGPRLEFTGKVVKDFSKSVWANLPVKITLMAKDAVGQMGKSVPVVTSLPGRKFFDSLAAALVEQRRDLLWSDFNAPRVAKVLRAIINGDKDIFRKETDYLRLRFIIARLEAALHNSLLDYHRDELAEALWVLALSVEEFDVESALERMRRAQERLAQAMKNGASKEDIAELMRELSRANLDYLRQLSSNTARDVDKSRQGVPEGETMTLSQNDIQDMMERIQNLIEEGRVAEAQKALQELQAIMENMQIAEVGGGEGSQDQAATEGLVDTLREQQGLSDEAFRRLQELFESQQNGQGNRQGGDGTELIERNGMANRQGSLRERLESQRKALPGFEYGVGPLAKKSLKETEEAMRRAEKSLEEGDFSGALDDQAEAMDNLRDVVRSLSESIADNEGRGAEQGTSNRPISPRDQSDPLGRLGGIGSKQIDQKNDLPVQGMAKRAQELFEEIRRKTSELDRPVDERTYLKKLIDKF